MLYIRLQIMNLSKEKYTIFIVDDDPFIRRSLEIKLKGKETYELHSFSSGESCIDALSEDPDLVIMDYNMGDHLMNGMDAMLKIKELKPETEVAILSAQDDIPVAIEILNQGAIEYLTKEHVLGINVEKSVEDLIAKKELKDELAKKDREIKQKKEELEIAQKEILTANQELKDTNANLDELVKKRTSALVNTLNKLKDSKEELENFVYRASHDLKGPTARLLGLIQIFELMPEDRTALRHMEKVIQGLDKVVENFIYVHTLHKSPLKKEEISLSEFITSEFDKLRGLPEATGIDLRYEIQGNDHVKTDPLLLQIILRNLVENAIYFHKKSEEQDRFVQVEFQNSRDNLVIEVEDNGMGIAESIRKKVFQMFFRGAEHSDGNGLGLYLVNKAVNKLEGNITLSSEENSYTHFSIKIPLANFWNIDGLGS